jgi:hypothetical protein
MLRWFSSGKRFSDNPQPIILSPKKHFVKNTKNLIIIAQHPSNALKLPDTNVSLLSDLVVQIYP